ncbi:hypothetical protein Tco_0502809 [Tanacetum coccineum]
MKRSGVGLSIGVRGCGGTSFACPGPDMPPEEQSWVTYEGDVEWLISLATGVHKLSHAGDQPGGDSRLLCGKARDISLQAHDITSAGRGGGGAYAGAGASTGISGATSLAASPASLASKHQPQWPTASLVPGLPKPMCRRTWCIFGVSQARVDQSMGALG